MKFTPLSFNLLTTKKAIDYTLLGTVQVLKVRLSNNIKVNSDLFMSTRATDRFWGAQSKITFELTNVVSPKIDKKQAYSTLEHLKYH